jgi:hypothetical protein
MALHAAVASRRLGQLVGGAAGAQRVVDANAWMETQQIVNSSRMSAVLAPGSWPA